MKKLLQIDVEVAQIDRERYRNKQDSFKEALPFHDRPTFPDNRRYLSLLCITSKRKPIGKRRQKRRIIPSVKTTNHYGSYDNDLVVLTDFDTTRRKWRISIVLVRSRKIPLW